GPIDTQDIRVVQAPDVRADLGLRNRRYLVHHQPASHVQSVALVRIYRKPEERRLGLIGREGAYGDGSRFVEGVILHDDDGARLACIALAAGDGPDVAASHSSSQSDTASMNAWSSAARALAATASAWRCASDRNSGARTSGTQI